ncbi:MAG: hypothetical protein M1814_005556 [Vezdaea aestivalis]|nr:MAG: hypothetical protein M1814_005556 [Vezdaea aestivalis]
MTTKHFLSDPTTLVPSALSACARTNPSLAFDKANKILYRRPGHRHQIAIISGGGSGHEPSFAGYVGAGMLSATVAGTIFASPGTHQISTALRARVDPSRGVLTIILNYTGDVLHFGLAVEQAKAAGLEVEMIVVGDDVGVGRAQAGKVGRRGLAGCVLVHKIAGAFAASGGSLSAVASLARLVSENIVTIGASLEHVHVPGHGPVDPSNALKEGEVEIGMGVHNEPGCERANLELPELIAKMLRQMLSKDDDNRAFLNVNSNEVVLLVNNLGGLSNLELGGITAEILDQLSATWKIHPVRILAGTYMTSLNGAGFSITLLNVVNTNLGGPSMIQLLDAPAECTGWTAPIRKETWEARNQAVFDANITQICDAPRSDLVMDADDAKIRLKRALQAVIAYEADITAFDTIVGDGDCGIGLKRGSETVIGILESSLSKSILQSLSLIARAVAESMDGTSGAIVSIFLSALTSALLSYPSQQEPKLLPMKDWAVALDSAIKALGKYTPAREGDRTLMDALVPFVRTLNETSNLQEASIAAMIGAKKTKGMQAALGRSVYVGGDGFKKVPDPGAWGVAIFLVHFAGLESKGIVESVDEEFEII